MVFGALLGSIIAIGPGETARTGDERRTGEQEEVNMERNPDKPEPKNTRQP